MLEIQNVSKTFNAGTVNEKTALNGLNLKLNEGDFVTVIGIHADSANLRFTLDILLRNLSHHTASIFRNALLHNNGQNAFVGKQTLNTLIVAGIGIHLGYALRQIIFFLLHGISAPFPCLYYTLFLYFLQ